MRWFQLTLLGLALAQPACAEDIVDVLRRSQQVRLDAMPLAADSPKVEVLRRSFEQVRRALPEDVVAELRVVSSGTIAETLHGRVVVVHESLADMPEGARLFVIAHELGHVASHHWQQMGAVYRHWIPGEVKPETTDPVAGLLGREASAASHRQEYEADAYAMRTLKAMGRTPQDAFSAFVQQGMLQDTATHPGTRKRVASLRAAMAGAGSGADAE
jgi:Zn-dependent protease with chaperone function